MYKLGYCMLVIEEMNKERYAWINELKKLCDELVVGIPNEWTMARLFGDRPYNANEYRDFMLSMGIFRDVIILDFEKLRYPKIIDEINPDAIFYGSEYGVYFLQDYQYAVYHGVTMVSIVPGVINPKGFCDAPIRLALGDVRRNQKIVLFGTGKYFDEYMDRFGDKYKPEYAIDNDSSKWGSKKRNVIISCPDVLQSEELSDVLVVICSKSYQEIKRQLFDMGVTRYRTLLYNYELAFLEEFGVIALEEENYLRENHRILTLLMKEFDSVCRENKLHYYVICGSLIGVVRHKGMIPWDDDVDIAMPRGDYKKLKKLARKKWGKDNKAFQFVDYMNIGGGAFLDCMPRLFYMQERLPIKCFDKVAGKATADIENRVFLDIYVMDRAHVNKKIHNFVTNIAMKGIYNLMMGHRAVLEYEEYQNMLTDKEFNLMKKVHKFGSHLPIKFLAFWYDAFARSGNWNRKAPDVIMESCAIRCVDLKYPACHFGEGLRVPFENIETMIPSDYDAHLEAMRYHNYMEFPRMSVRKPSHYFNSDIEVW